MHDVRTPRIAVSALFVLNGGLFGIWASRVPTVKSQLGLDHGDLGLALLAMAAGAICAFPLAGRLADSRGAARVTKVLAVFYVFSLMFLPLAQGFYGLAGALFLFGAIHGGMDVAMNSWAAEVERHLARPLMQTFHAMFSLGAGLGAASGYLALSMNMTVLAHFLVTGLMLAAVTFFLAAVPWTSNRVPKTKGPLFALPHGPLILVGFVAFCTSMGEGAMADWSAVYLIDISQVSAQQAALGYTIFSVSMVAVRLIGDRIVTALGPALAARLSGIAAATGASLAVTWPGFGAILVGFGLMGLGYAVIIPLAFSRAANDPVVPAGQAIASVATLGYGGILIGPAAIGFIADATSLRVSFAVLAFLAILIIVLAKVLRPPG